MKRIMIIGSNGAGKTTLSYKLSEKMGLPLIHIDKIYWRNYWEVTPKEEFEEIILSEARKKNWIIEGNNIQSINQRVQYADTVIWFEFSPILCMWNILKREIKWKNKVRPDMPDKCVSKVNFKFLKDVWNFNKRNCTRIEGALKEAEKVDIIRFTNYRQVRKFLKNIENR